MSEEHPPLRVREIDGSPNLIPVFDLIISGGTVTRVGAVAAQIGIPAGGSATTQVPSSRAINTVFPLAGGGDLSTDRTHSVSTAGFLVTSARAINVLFPVSGGGNLGVDRVIAVDTLFLVNTNRTIAAGSGLSGTSNLGSDVQLSINTNVRDRMITFFAPAALSTTAAFEQMRIRIPFNMDLVSVFLALASTALTTGVTSQILQYSNPSGAGERMYTTSANFPMIYTNQAIGSAGAAAIGTLFAGSFLGIDILQVGAAGAQGSGMTVTLVARTS